VPIAWQKDHKGMQGSEYLDDISDARLAWKEAARYSKEWARILSDMGVTKQICNRLLEPFVWLTEIITATEWDNFFELRCPKYNINGYEFKSVKDAIKKYPKDAKYTNVLDWLRINHSQAEIHIQKIAEMMWDDYNESKPKELKAGQHHLPFIEIEED
jgi:DNA-directed RNA polymerase subunit N (RpoN/RPB10)